MSFFIFYCKLVICKLSGLITFVGEERVRELLFCYRLRVILWFLFGGVSSAS